MLSVGRVCAARLRACPPVCLCVFIVCLYFFVPVCLPVFAFARLCLFVGWFVFCLVCRCACIVACLSLCGWLPFLPPGCFQRQVYPFLFVCQPVGPSVRLVCCSTCPSVRLPVRLPACLPAFLFACLIVCDSVCRPGFACLVRLFVCIYNTMYA